MLEVRVGGKDADAEAVGAGFAGGNRTAIEIAAVPVLAGLIQHCDGRIFNSAVVGLAMIHLDPDMLRIDGAEMNPRPYF